jgi:hypothetical protein
MRYMTQHSFDFTTQINEKDKEIQRWVEQHNQQVVAAAQMPQVSPGTLLSALDGNEAKANSVYMMRTVLGQCLRKSLVPGVIPFKRRFIQVLRGEITIKKSSQDPAFAIRNVLVKLHSTH